MESLETRTSLPDALRILVDRYPRDLWQSHHNFDGHTRFWMQRHAMFRDLLSRATTLTEGYLDGLSEPRAFGGQGAQIIGMLLNELHSHHQIEDMHFFPVISPVDQRLSPGFDLLEADHQVLDRHIHGLANTTNATLRALQSGAARDEAAVLRGDLIGFQRFLNRHLCDEEDLVIPAILHHAIHL